MRRRPGHSFQASRKELSQQARAATFGRQSYCLKITASSGLCRERSTSAAAGSRSARSRECPGLPESRKEPANLILFCYADHKKDGQH